MSRAVLRHHSHFCCNADEAASNLEPNQPGTAAEIIDTLNSGHTIPRLGWGSFNSKGRESTNAVVDAVNAGFRVSLHIKRA